MRCLSLSSSLLRYHSQTWGCANDFYAGVSALEMDVIWYDKVYAKSGHFFCRMYALQTLFYITQQILRRESIMPQPSIAGSSREFICALCVEGRMLVSTCYMWTSMRMPKRPVSSLLWLCYVALWFSLRKGSKRCNGLLHISQRKHVLAFTHGWDVCVNWPMTYLVGKLGFKKWEMQTERKSNVM